MSALIDRGIVHDYADEYGEPGYHSEGMVILGDYWCHCDKGPDKDKEGSKLHGMEFHYPRLFAALEEQGHELEWYDEWITTHENSPTKAYRTTADSYSWQSSILWCDGDFLTPDDGIEAWIEETVNDPHRCISSAVWSKQDIEAQGFREYQCGLENGWHPGQTDDPEVISKQIKKELGPDVDILYQLSENSQFYIGFCVFVRDQKEDEDDE